MIASLRLSLRGGAASLGDNAIVSKADAVGGLLMPFIQSIVLTQCQWHLPLTVIMIVSGVIPTG